MFHFKFLIISKKLSYHNLQHLFNFNNAIIIKIGLILIRIKYLKQILKVNFFNLFLHRLLNIIFSMVCLDFMQINNSI